MKANPIRQIKPPSQILVINTRRIGDALLTTPLICSLRRAWPEARIDVLVSERAAGVLSSNSDIDQILTIAENPDWRSHLRLLRHIWRRYDLAISTLPADRPILYAWLAGKHSAGLVEEGRSYNLKQWLLSQSVQFDNINIHTVLMNLELADLFGIPRCHEVVAAWRAEDAAAVCKTLPFDPETQAYVVLHTYPKYAYKTWRREAWVELADWLNSQGILVVLTGGKSADEIAYVQSLLGLLPGNTVNTAGKLSLAGVAYLLSRARACVGPDTVVTHLAAASGTPTVALFGPSNPVKWGPWPKGYEKDSNPYVMRGTQRVNNVVLLQGEGDCVPCMEEGCERHLASLSHCLQNLPAANVVNALQDLWRDTGAEREMPAITRTRESRRDSGNNVVAADITLTPLAATISIVIPLYNQLKYTKLCMESLRSTLTMPAEIILVDNASTDGTADYLRTLSWVKIISNAENLGFAGGCNTGIRAASGEWIVVLNNDVIVSPGWLEGMLEAANYWKLQIVTPAIREGEYTYDINAYARELTSRMRRVIRRGRANGICFMAHRSVFDSVGLFDEKFLIGQYEDKDFFLRAARSGFALGTVGAAFLHHFGSATQKAMKHHPAPRPYALVNKAYFARKWKLPWWRRLIDRTAEKFSDKAASTIEKARYGHTLMEKMIDGKLHYE
jgi:lipopolysaccharide heptosyltransferase III